MRLRLVPLLALLLGLLAACGQEQITADEIVRRVQEAQQTTQDMHTILDFSMTSPEESMSASVELWTKKATGLDNQPATKARAKVLAASVAEATGAELVSDGVQGWAWLPAENKVYVGKLADLEEFGGEHGGERGGIPTDPLAATDQLRGLVERGLDSFIVEIEGEETVAGRPAYKVKLTPRQDGEQAIELLLTAYLWVDQERFLPLKLTIDAGAMGSGEITARMLETNTGIADTQFVFVPPLGAEVIDVVSLFKQSAPQAMTLDEARAAVDFAVLTPGSLPAGVKLVQVQVFGGDTVIQVYSGQGSEFSLVQTSDAAFDQLAVGQDRGSTAQDVTVRGQPGRLVEAEGRRAMSMLSWQEQGIQVAITGRISGEQSQQIAAGLR